MINTLFFFSIRNCAVHQNTRTSICESKMNAIAHAQLAFQILTLQKKNIQNDSVKFLEVEKYVHDKWQIILANNNSTNSNLHNLMIIQENNTVLLMMLNTFSHLQMKTYFLLEIGHIHLVIAIAYCLTVLIQMFHPLRNTMVSEVAWYLETEYICMCLLVCRMYIHMYVCMIRLMG